MVILDTLVFWTFFWAISYSASPEFLSYIVRYVQCFKQYYWNIERSLFKDILKSKIGFVAEKLLKFII